ncbi:DHA2 family efflux MFS transporter permease subunit [Glaciihabitans arcticus]|uniref:DHA2 family efflux MFS transporter permease subunit n=1 Tax=Glaciihabitans arcticus TaxID=2668039 RepID=A0A4Q9GRT0_9MICO|nr:DHA2 family efflux MFS transporter permease subunit [Glaciihabitans arcticus]TBN56814.1 DHA2 family efflux MFS transporter permease subunit [Glaciihabitans arcticus]
MTRTASIPIQSPSDPTGAALAKRNNLVISLLLGSAFVVILNETIMNVALPRIMEDLGIAPSVGQWLTTAFLLTMAIVIPITGFILERFDTRPVFLTAMALFSVGTVTAALAPGFALLLVGRVVQACGTAIMMPLLMTTVLTLVASSDRGRIMGRISIVMSVAPALGPTFSGLILNVLPWPWLFWVVLPIALAALIVGAVLMPNVTESRKIPIDVLSVILSAFAFGGLIYGLSSLGEAAEGNALIPAWVPLVGGLVLLALFILRQLHLQKSDRALLDLRTFTSRNFTFSIILLSVSMVALFGTIIIIPLYAQNVLGLLPLETGLLLLPGGLVMGLLGPIVGRLYDRFGPTVLLVPGTIVLSLVFWGLSMVQADSPVFVILIAHVSLSVGLALLFTPVFTAGLGSLKPHLYSHGSAIVGTLQQVAGAAGTAIFIALMTVVGVSLAAGGAPEGEATAGGIRAAFTFGAILATAAIPLAFFVRRPEETSGEPQAAHH